MASVELEKFARPVEEAEDRVMPGAGVKKAGPLISGVEEEGYE